MFICLMMNIGIVTSKFFQGLEQNIKRIKIDSIKYIYKDSCPVLLLMRPVDMRRFY